MGKKKRSEKQLEHLKRQEKSREERRQRKEINKEKEKNKWKEYLLKDDDEKKFINQLNLIGLRIKYIQGDGNCLFRSIADQIEGNEGRHSHYRQLVMDYIEDNRELFEPFMEDDELIDNYIIRMKTNGEWGGHQELYAASQMLSCQIIVHQYDSPRYEFIVDQPLKSIHLSYHGECHYNSVRMNEDYSTNETPMDIIIQDLSINTNHENSEEKSEEKNNNNYEKKYKSKKKIGRSEPCPCGSGKKYKKCCRRKDLKESKARKKQSKYDDDDDDDEKKKGTPTAIVI